MQSSRHDSQVNSCVGNAEVVIYFFICFPGESQFQSASQVKIITETSVEKVERLAKRGQQCVAVLGRRTGDIGSVCDDEVCFICRN